MNPTLRAILLGAGAAGTLDLLSAFVFSGIAGRTPVQVLRSVAGGPFPDLAKGPAGPAVGALTHFAIMTCMVTAFVLAARRMPILRAQPLATGALYGVGLYLVMYWIVLPLRFPQRFPQLGWWNVGNALFSHVVCVGFPIALIAAAVLGRRGAPA